MVKEKSKNIVREWYTDFYGCRYRITRDIRTGLCLLTGYVAGTDRVFLNSRYDTYRGAKIALGRYSDGTARQGRYTDGTARKEDSHE